MFIQYIQPENQQGMQKNIVVEVSDEMSGSDLQIDREAMEVTNDETDGIRKKNSKSNKNKTIMKEKQVDKAIDNTTRKKRHTGNVKNSKSKKDDKSKKLLKKVTSVKRKSMIEMVR